MSGHPNADSIARYASGGDLPADVLWAVEAHLETCQTCRLRLADAAPPQVTALTAAVWAELEPSGEPARRRHRLARWATPALLPWLAMTAFAVLAALALDGLLPAGGVTAAVLLIAPIVPVLGVAAAWSRGMDPAHELVVSTPRAGLQLVLRRTFAVLVVVLPVLLVGGWLAGASPAYWLLPCLGVTAVALALGGLIGVRRAAITSASSWAVLVIGPAVLGGGVPGVLAPGAAPVWAAVLVGGAAAVFFRSAAYARL
ncbi:zf-HC2 domain-containing protein [Saccharothrix sp. S26]|uniref:zf-HC2 domain-containing protein n=1 Tax=Saccharothrix sp. S26 TaxID=2907215 RepID=UPI001F3EFDF3|nr:zf-HC2 domain-containing protein [Saccharothrix sp. S26]MCE6999437.1 zf-HC2 domain-containing protein [Saccharothrix sp. S26]